MSVFMMAFSERTMGSLRTSTPSRGEVNHASNSPMSFSTCCSSSVIGNSFQDRGIRVMEGTAMNKNEVIVTDVAVLSSDEVVQALERIEALAGEGKPAEALMLLYKLLRTVCIVRRAINERPIREHEKHIQMLTHLEDALWHSAATLNNSIVSSAN